MRIPLAYILGSVALLIIVALTPHFQSQLPFPVPADELKMLAYIAFTVALVWLAAEHHLEGLEGKFEEKMEPLLKRLSGDLRAGIEQGLGTTNSTLQGGLREIAGAMAQELHRVSEGWKEFLNPQLVNKLMDEIYNTDLKTLAKQGRVQEAIARLGPAPETDTAELHQKISLLVISKDEKNWREAIDLLEHNPTARKADYYLSLAFRYWSVGKLDEAITLGERGMNTTADPESIAKFENSLAYYYADAARLDKRELAFQYAQAAIDARPSESGPIDTMGFLKITFGASEKEVMEGVDLCTKAWELGTPFELYAKHIQKATQRLEEMRRSGGPKK